jgi:uncharacterized membrane protein HdeD (DUF308 family)
MTDVSMPTVDSGRWSVQLAAVGLAIAALTVVVGFFGLVLPSSLYWIGILLSLGGIVGAAAYGSRDSNWQYGAGVISAVVGVLVLGYGVEKGILLATVVGVLLIIVGVAGVVTTRREVQ